VRERTIGVLNCYTASLHHFTAEEIALFSTLANQTALAIENARLVTNTAVVREMHHRIKNNLQNVAMLLRLQMGRGREVTAREVLHDAINRIQSIAAVHDILAQKGFRQIDVKELLTRVAHGVVQNMATPELNLQLRVEGVSFSLPTQPVTSLALVINELVQNAMEHAFVGRDQGCITVRFSQDPTHWIVTVLDDGVGLAGGSAQSLGLQIVETLVVEDLQGQFLLAVEEGTMATIKIPRSQP
jgi:two-component sensor histidine kinase